MERNNGRRGGRRGTVEISLTTLLESFVVFVLCVLLLIFAMRVYQIFFGPDKETLNTYELMADSIDGLIRSDEETKRLTFLFTYPVAPETQGLMDPTTRFTGRERYEGTIYAVGSDGRISAPFPAWTGGSAPGLQTDPNTLSPPITPADVSRRCKDGACLCFTKKIVPYTAAAEELRDILTNPFACRSFTFPEEELNITFDFSQPAIALAPERFPSAELRKETAPSGLITVRVALIGD